MIDPNLDNTLMNIPGGAGDRRIYFTLLCYGKIHCIQKTMSAYRHITAGGSSFSATHTYVYDTQQEDLLHYLNFSYSLGHPEAIRIAEFLYLRNIRYASRKGFVKKPRAQADKRNIRHPFRASCLLLKRDINFRILHKRIHL